jgi:hypothetical protein
MLADDYEPEVAAKKFLLTVGCSPWVAVARASSFSVCSRKPTSSEVALRIFWRLAGWLAAA